ncbi:uncharacterized protein C11orf16 homolog [Echinops telfairi]|uniref:Uncharacterized protein C11orf16 homolog n=1 Tax=Echinops telfairi TaxID=9371 RepID=A0AC55D547_ECHTE|nr:uncharacterized protein C11orf16 homolog [Echinops telfairi]
MLPLAYIHGSLPGNQDSVRLIPNSTDFSTGPGDACTQILQCDYHPEGTLLGWGSSSLGPVLRLPLCPATSLAHRAQPPHKLERQGALLVEFEAPQITGPRLSVQRHRHRVVLKEEAIQLSPPIVSPLRPGDKVLAPWEPNGQRYGPGTVLLGLETREPERGPKDEEITVHFWNGKTTTVPPGGAIWVPLVVWQAAVERLHKPVTREHLGPLLWAPCCSLPGPGPGCVHTGLPLGTQFLCPLCPSHTCCQPLCLGSLCCCPSARPTWWPLPGTLAEDTAGELPGPELKPTAQLLPLEGPQELAVQAPVSLSPSTSTSAEDDLENDLRMGLPPRLQGSSTLNTAAPVLEKPPRQRGLCQPAWRYWRRNGFEPRPRQPGARPLNLSGKKQPTDH